MKSNLDSGFHVGKVLCSLLSSVAKFSSFGKMTFSCEFIFMVNASEQCISDNSGSKSSTAK